MKWILKTSTVRVATQEHEGVCQSLDEMPAEPRRKLRASLEGSKRSHDPHNQPGSLRLDRGPGPGAERAGQLRFWEAETSVTSFLPELQRDPRGRRIGDRRGLADFALPHPRR